MNMSSTNMNAKINGVSPQQGQKKGDKPDEMSAGFDSLFASMFSRADRPLNTVQNQFQQGLLQSAPERRPAQVPALNNVASAVHSAISAQNQNGQPAQAHSPAAQQPSSSTSVSAEQSSEQAGSPAAADAGAKETQATENQDAAASAGAAQVSQLTQNQTDVETQTEGLDSEGSLQAALPESPNAHIAKAADSKVSAESTQLQAAVKSSTDSQKAEANDAPQKTPNAVDQNRSQTAGEQSSSGKADSFLKNADHRIQTESSGRTDAAASADRAGARGAEAAVRGEINSQIAQSRADLVAQAAQAADTRAQSGLKAGEVKLAAGELAGAGKAGSPVGIGGIQAQQPLGTGLAREASIKTPVNQPGFAQELGQKVNWAIGKNLSTVDIKLNPDQFGSMNLRIVQKGQQIHLTIRTADEATASMLNQATGALKEVLAQSGLQLNQVQITSSAQSQQSFAQNFGSQQGQNSGQTQNGQQGGHSGHNQQGQGGSGGQQAGSEDAAPVERAARRLPNSDGLDLFA